ncbi:MAG TPA: outer membrane beta-barrel protein [Burkholderiales bacterium]|nr:outer membrane beta-barrel protein [Burkholderiales bacterium]
MARKIVCGPTNRLAHALLWMGLGLGAAGQAAAQSSGGWEFEVTPYLWGAALDGDIQLGDLPKTEVDESFSDILDVLDIGVIGTFEARKDRWGFLFDGMYLKISDDAATAGPLFGDVEVEVISQLYQFAGTYRVVEGSPTVDLVGGARYNYVKGEIEIDPGILAGRRGSRSVDWWDGFVGARAIIPFAERWSLVGYADIGAGDSDLTWQALAGVNYHFSPAISAKLRYRSLSVDYEKSNFLYDMNTSGLNLGVGIRF